MAPWAAATAVLALGCCGPALGAQWLQWSWPPPPTTSSISEIRVKMQAEPGNLQVQTRGCQMLQEISNRDRDEWDIAPFTKSKRVATKFLDEGLGEGLAMGVLHSLSAPAPDSLVRPAAQQCIWGIQGLAVNYHAEKGRHLMQHSPHLWEAYVKFLERFKSDKQLLPGVCMFAGLCGMSAPECTPPLAAAGGFKFVFELMEDPQLKEDDTIFQAALCALSDNVQGSREGAALVANEGGPLNGVRVLLRAMRSAHGRKFKERNGFGLQYEVVHDTNGLLWHDDANHTWRDEFLRGGYAEELLALMGEDPSEPKLQDNACQAMHYISEGNDPVRAKLEGLGAVELMASAMKLFGPQKLEGYCTVIHSCSTALLGFARASEAARHKMQTLGVADVLVDDVVNYAGRTNSGTPGHENFPAKNVKALRQFLVSA